MFTPEEAREMARKHVAEKFGTKRGWMKAAARELRMSPDGLSDLQRGKGAPPTAVLESMGLKRVLMYVEKEPS